MLKYSLNELPPKPLIPVFGLQHVLTMLGATVAVPTIISGAFGLGIEDTALLISNVLIAMGIATLVQVLFGTRLPIIQGSSFAFLPAMTYVASIYPGQAGLTYVGGAVIIGALMQAFLGLSGVAGLLQRILTPVVVGPTIMVIGLSLFTVGGSQASQDWFLSIATIILIFLFGFGLTFARSSFVGIRSVFSTFPVILAVASIWAFCAILSLLGIFDITHPGHISFEKFVEQPPVRFSGYIFPWGLPKFDLAFLVVFLIAYLVSTVESIGDYNAVNEISSREPETLRPRAVSRGVLAEGIGCFLASIFGANPTTSYSENIGVVGITGVASRIVIITAAIILIIAGALPIIGAVLASIPGPVMGGLYCVLFGLISGIGLRYAAKANLQSMRNVSIIGFSLFFGFAVPSVFSDGSAQEAIINALGSGFSDILLGIVTSNMAMTAISALILDNTFTKDKEEF